MNEFNKQMENDTVSDADMKKFVEDNTYTGFIKDEESLENTADRIPIMTSRIFFECCKAGYNENNYDTENLNPCEAYLRFSDRRDDGLTKLPIDDADAFLKWYEGRPRCGHPWEVCRGGNSTHVSLYVAKDEKGFWFIVAGSSESRFLESINFYMAIKRLGYPVEIRHGVMLANRLKGNEVIVMPQRQLTTGCLTWADQILVATNATRQNINNQVRQN